MCTAVERCDAYTSLADLLHWYTHAATFTHPKLLSLGQAVDTGHTHTQLPVLNITSSAGDKSVAVLVFGEHASELITCEVGLWLVRVLVGDTAEIFSWPEWATAFKPLGISRQPDVEQTVMDWVARILDKLFLKVIPVANIDGRQAWEAGNLCQRKTMHGVDLNHNYPFAFVKQPTHADSYGGPFPFSEPHSRIIARLSAVGPAHDHGVAKAYINVHSGEWAVYSGWDSKAAAGPGMPADLSDLLLRSGAVCDCQAGPAGAVSKHLSYGTGMDFMHSQLGVPYALTYKVYGSDNKGRLQGRTNQPLESFPLANDSSIARTAPHPGDIFPKSNHGQHHHVHHPHQLLWRLLSSSIQQLPREASSTTAGRGDSMQAASMYQVQAAQPLQRRLRSGVDMRWQHEQQQGVAAQGTQDSSASLPAARRHEIARCLQEVEAGTSEVQQRKNPILDLVHSQQEHLKRCFTAYNPPPGAAYREVVSRWVVVLLMTLHHVADPAHPRPSLHPLPGTVLAGAGVGDMAARNPLLADMVFPPYDQIKPEHVVPGVRQLLAELGQAVDRLEASLQPTWLGLVEPLERIMDRYRRVLGIVYHLKDVQDSPALRSAVQVIQPELVKLSLRLGQSKLLYAGFKGLRDGATWASLPPTRRRIVDTQIRDFQMAGIALQGDTKTRFNTVQQDLTRLSSQFRNNVNDATKAFKKLLTRREEVAGLPNSLLGLAAQNAAAEGHTGATAESGPWLVTLDSPCYFPLMSHAQDRALREEMYRAYITLASSGAFNNAPVIEEVLALRGKKAQLLGYGSYANLSMASKMADLPAATSLLEELRAAGTAAALAERDALLAFAKSQGFEDELEWWDIEFWAERLRQSQFHISDEELRPYLALPAVLEGLWQLTRRLFGVDVVPADGEVPVWHKNVQFFKLLKAGTPIAYLYLDAYSRPAEKRGGAWMDVVVGRSGLMAPPGQAVRLPVALIVCSQMPPVGDQPSLMEFDDVQTLFHEFGHALQHMLTEVTDGLAAGLRGIEWDAVELSSQFMENWVHDRATLASFAKHYKTGEPLPEALFSRLQAARTFRAGTRLLRHVYLSAVDLRLHSSYLPGQGKTAFDVYREVAAQVLVKQPLPEDRYLCTFSHVFAGGYAAGYYSYLWAEVLAADAFAAFQEAGLDNDTAVGRAGARFRDTVLALGGSVAPAEVFRRFRGRAPSTRPLLQHYGLVGSDGDS